MKLNEFFDSVYCINLDSRLDRWDTSLKEFEKIGFIPERFSAIPHEQSWRGCYLSHLEILKQAREKKESVLIFEDDVEFINYDEEIITNTLKELDAFHWWDMFYLGGNILKPFYQITDHLGKLTHCQSTHAYAVNKFFLDRLIHWLESNQVYIIDVLYAEGVVPLRNCFISIPMMAIQRADYSDIEKRKMTYDLPIERYNKFLVKRKF
jgi:GR25 family glycosyltransferase involved in LPS biosynthesis